jgi:hypothetical protein
MRRGLPVNLKPVWWRDEGALNLLLELNAEDIFWMGQELHPLVHQTLPSQLPVAVTI